MDTPSDRERDRLLKLLCRYGWNATSFQLLDPDFSYWFEGEDACVAYVDTGAAWVVGGSPIAAIERMGEVAARFIGHASAHHRRVVFFGVEERFLRAIGLRSVQIGEQPWWDPAGWKPRRSLREQFRRARAKGIAVERLDAAALGDGTSPLCGEIERLIARWLASRPMPPMAFLVDLNPFRFAAERRYYVAWGSSKDAGREVRSALQEADRGMRGANIAGFLVAAPVYLRDGWFIEDIIRDPAAPNGTAEALVDAAMRDVARDGSRFVTLGLAPLSGGALWLRVTRRALAGFYNFEGLRAFKAKLHPTGWDPIHLAFPEGQPVVLAVHDVLDAFAKGHVFRFALRSLLRAPSIVLQALAALLLPWIVALAMAGSRWFPSPVVRLAWIAFDVVIAAVLFSLGKRWRKKLARATLVAVSLDVLLTGIQVALFNARRPAGWLDFAMMSVSLAAPALAAAVLAGGLARRKSP